MYIDMQTFFDLNYSVLSSDTQRILSGDPEVPHCQGQGRALVSAFLLPAVLAFLIIF
jgi:hypothetical protein